MHEDYPISRSLQRTAHALRPMRIHGTEPIHYEATTYLDNPYRGCETQIRRMECFGMLTRRDGQLQGNWFLDVLDVDGDILDTLEVNSVGVKYMRRTLRMRRESTALLEAFDQLAACSPRQGSTP